VPKVKEDGPFWDVRLAAVGAGCRVIHVGTQAEDSLKMQFKHQKKERSLNVVVWPAFAGKRVVRVWTLCMSAQIEIHLVAIVLLGG